MINNEQVLTKRELIAVMAMQGFLSAWETTSWPKEEEVAARSIKMADELIKQLGK